METRHGTPIGSIDGKAIKVALGTLRERGSARKGWLTTEAGALPQHIAARVLALGPDAWTLTDRCIVASWTPKGASRGATVALVLQPEHMTRAGVSVPLAVALGAQEATAIEAPPVAVAAARKVRKAPQRVATPAPVVFAAEAPPAIELDEYAGLDAATRKRLAVNAALGVGSRFMVAA